MKAEYFQINFSVFFFASMQARNVDKRRLVRITAGDYMIATLSRNIICVTLSIIEL